MDVLNLALSVIVFILVVGTSVLIHEWAHLKTGQWAGIAIRSLNVGFGYSIRKWKRNGVEYRVGIIPLGGYVHFYGGRRPEASKQKWNEQAPPGAGINWWEATLPKRLAVGASGSAINLAIGLGGLFWIDAIRNGALSAPQALWGHLKVLFSVLGSLIINPLSALSSPDVTGPAGIVRVIADAGVSPLVILALFAVVNLSLAVFNLLPIPPLDGGMMLLGAADEGCRKWLNRPLPETAGNVLVGAGFAWVLLVTVSALTGDFT